MTLGKPSSPDSSNDREKNNKERAERLRGVASQFDALILANLSDLDIMMQFVSGVAKNGIKRVLEREQKLYGQPSDFV